MKFRLFTYILFSLVFSLSACKEEVITEEISQQLNYEDAVLQQIRNLQHERNVSQLMPFLSHRNPQYRYAATLALASVRDSSLIDNALAARLNDQYPLIREIAAFSMGQTERQSAADLLVKAFRRDTLRDVQGHILEAVGRTSNEEHLKHLSTAPPYPMKDTGLVLGQALGIYRFALRGITIPEGTKRMFDLMGSVETPQEVRLITAAYSTRISEKDLRRFPSYETILRNQLLGNKSGEIRQFAALSLGKVGSSSALRILQGAFNRDKDYRVRCNIIRGMRAFPYDSVRTLIFKAIQDPNPAVQVCAAQYLLDQGKDYDALQYEALTENATHWQLKTLLHAAALHAASPYRTQTKATISRALKVAYDESKNPQERAYILKHMGYFGWNYRFLMTQALPAHDTLNIPKVEQSAAAEGLRIIRSNSRFAQEFGISSRRVREELNIFVQEAIGKGDLGVQTVFAEMLADPAANFQKVYEDEQFLLTAMQNLPRPQGLETFFALNRALKYLTGRSLPAPKSNKVQPIDWQLLLSIPQNTQLVIQTSQGDLIVELYPNEAPAAVANFIQLAQKNFYNDKAFHRVVPNFVIQQGCPRGDGWGALDYTIPTEISTRRFDQAGYLGMASAGPDTESAQWFITHRAAPHLDGKYTIFGKVVQGMDVLHKIRMGDKVLNMQLQ